MIKEEVVDSYRALISELANETINDRIKSIDDTVRLFEGRIATQEQITDGIDRKLNVDRVVKQLKDYEDRIAKLETQVNLALEKAERTIREHFEAIENERLGLLEHRLGDIESHLGL